MKKVYLVQIEKDNIITCELSKKGYEWYDTADPAESNLTGHWEDDWSEPISLKDLFKDWSDLQKKGE